MDETPNNGIKEGIARCCSQACIFGIEARKTLIQVHGYVPKLPPNVVLHRWTTGILTSCLTSGLVFGTYFAVYNRISEHFLAGTIASITTSVIKLPISNGMRLMQMGGARSLLHACRKIAKVHTWKGLYAGYWLSLIEDIIEFDMRTRMYRALKPEDAPACSQQWNGFIRGGLVGAIASGTTTPFDTLRSKLLTRSAGKNELLHTMQISQALFASEGIKGLYRGVGMRMLSNAIKSATFFMIFESLPNI